MRKRLALLIIAIASGFTPVARADMATDKARAVAIIAYMNGDHAKAWKMMKPLAEQGDVPAQDWLGTLLAEGAGVPRDYVSAYMWKNIAAASTQGNNKAVYIKARDDIARKMTPAQIKRAQEMTLKCQASKYKQCN